MSRPAHADLGRLLEALSQGQVELIVVGGAAAVLHGAPITTHDLDVVHRRTEENVDRLLAVLGSLDTIVRDLSGRDLRPRRRDLIGPGQHQLLTALGPFDPLGALHDGRGYDELLGSSEVVTDGALSLRVLDLPTLIEIKLATGRAKDRLMVPVLVALLDERG